MAVLVSDKTILVILTALACPLVLPVVMKETEKDLIGGQDDE